MGDRDRVEIVTDGLREFRDYLREEATEELGTIKSNVDEARLPVAVWGVRLAGAVGAMPEPGGGQREPQVRLEGQIPSDADPEDPGTWHAGPFAHDVEWVDDPLTSFKKAYEAAHDGSVSRLNELVGILDEVAGVMHRIADYYDETDEENARAAERIETD